MWLKQDLANLATQLEDLFWELETVEDLKKISDKLMFYFETFKNKGISGKYGVEEEFVSLVQSGVASLVENSKKVNKIVMQEFIYSIDSEELRIRSATSLFKGFDVFLQLFSLFFNKQVDRSCLMSFTLRAALIEKILAEDVISGFRERTINILNLYGENKENEGSYTSFLIEVSVSIRNTQNGFIKFKNLVKGTDLDSFSQSNLDEVLESIEEIKQNFENELFRWTLEDLINKNFANQDEAYVFDFFEDFVGFCKKLIVYLKEFSDEEKKIFMKETILNILVENIKRLKEGNKIIGLVLNSS